MLFSCEIHYFRLEPAEWEVRIRLARSAGCDAVASYIPWLCHEPFRNVYDFSGRHDVGAFIDLVAAHGMKFIARPGPFVMAELKNEGLPYWLFKVHPHLRPPTWGGAPAESAIVIYNHPDFISEVERWYSKLAEILRPRLLRNGGNVVAVQLDNEVGMLHWLGNTPDLSDFTLQRFVGWLRDKKRLDGYGELGVTLEDSSFFPLMRNPPSELALRLVNDLHEFTRHDFAEYILKLRRLMGEKLSDLSGEVTYVFNIHGTSGGRAHTFPVGISQLRDVFKVGGVLPTTDLYLGSATVATITDLYCLNEMMRALTDGKYGSMEFECGNGDYGDSLEADVPDSIVFKTVLASLQGNEILNFYLFSGGRNYEDPSRPFDGNGRIGFTGEKHGIAAPVGPDGELDDSYHSIEKATSFVRRLEETVGDGYQLEYDSVSVLFVEAYYRTEYHLPATVQVKENIERFRGLNFYDGLLRGLLALGYRFRFTTLEKLSSCEDVLVVPCATFMPRDVQEAIKSFSQRGGALLLYGDLPTFDEFGKLCTILIDYLGVEHGEEFVEKVGFFPSVRATNLHEVRVGWLRELSVRGGTPAKVFLRTPLDGRSCGLILPSFNSLIVSAHLSAGYVFDVNPLAELGVKPNIVMEGGRKDLVGVYPFVLEGRAGSKCCVVFNLSHSERTFNLGVRSANYSGRISLQPREVKVLKL